MRVELLMVAGVARCRPSESLNSAAQRLRSSNCGVLPVVDSADRVLGVLTDRDVCVAAAKGSPTTLRVSDAMSSPARTCRVGDDVAVAERRMREARVRRLPVTDDEGVLAGILSVDDIARDVLRRGDELAAWSVLQTLVAATHFHPLEPGLTT